MSLICVQPPSLPQSAKPEATLNDGFRQAQRAHENFNDEVEAIVRREYPNAKIDERIIAEYLLDDMPAIMCAQAILKSLNRKQ